MSIPLWKQTILERKEKKKEDEKRKAAEAEQRRLDALPPWKRVIEERNVIIVSADKSSTPEVTVKKSDKTVSDGKHKSSNKVQVSTTTKKTANHENMEKNVDGVSEEHCSSVGDNPFLKLDRNRPRRSGDRTQNSNSRNGDIQSQSKTLSSSNYISGVNIRGDDHHDGVVQRNTKSSTTSSKDSTTLNQVKHVYNNSSDDLSESKFSDDYGSVDENDLVDKKQLSVSELLGRFRSSSQENLLDVGLVSPPRESRSLHSNNRAPRSKSLDRNTAKALNNTTTVTTINSLKSSGKPSTQSFINSKHFKSNVKPQNIMTTTKANEISQVESYKPLSTTSPVTIVSNNETDLQSRKKKSKPDLSASELIDLGEDAPLSPLSTLSPFNFEIIETAYIQRKLKSGMDDEEYFDSTRSRDVKTYNNNGNLQANKYKKYSGGSKSIANSSSHKFNNINKKATNSVESNSSKLSASNANYKVPSTGMTPKHNSVSESSPVPPPRNKKKKKAPKLEDVLKIEAHGEDVRTNVKQVNASLKTDTSGQRQHTPTTQADKHRKNQSSSKVNVIVADVKTEHARENKTSELPKVKTLPKQNNASLKNDEEQLPVSNIDDILLSPVKQEFGETLNQTDKGKAEYAKVKKDDGEKKKGIVKKITSVEFVGENESSGKPSILKPVDDNIDGAHKISKRSIKFDQQLSVTFEYASEVSANQFFDELESVDDSESGNVMEITDTNQTESSTDINQDDDDDIEHKSVDDGLKSNTSIGNKGLQGYVPNYLQNAYMSTIEKRRSQDVSQSSPMREVIEDEPIEAVPEPNSDLFSGWSSGSSAMLF